MLLLPLLTCCQVPDYGSMVRLIAQHTRCAAEACTGQPAACPAAVPGLASSRPSNGRYHNYSLNFMNTLSHGVVLSWLEANGTARPVTTLAPGEKRQLRSRTGDMWQAHIALAWDAPAGLPSTAPASDAPATLLMEHQVGPTLVRDCGCRDAPLVLCPPRPEGLKPHNATERPEYEPAGWLNAVGAPIEVYLRTSVCEMLVHRIDAGGQVQLSSWSGQSFRLRRADNQRLLLQQTVGDVLIRPCAGEAADHPEATLAGRAPSTSAQQRIEQLERCARRALL